MLSLCYTVSNSEQERRKIEMTDGAVADLGNQEQRDGSGRKVYKVWKYDLLGLRFFRERRRMSMRRLGELAGVGYSTICNLENGVQQAYPSTIEKLASALGVADWELLTKDHDQTAWEKLLAG